MTYEEVKELLKSVRSKKRRLLALQEYITKERELLRSAGSLDFSVPAIKSSGENGIEKWYVSQLDRIQKWTETFEALLVQMCEEEDRLATAMQYLSPQEYELILNRYLMGLSRKQTAELMGYTEDGIKTATTRAMKKMSKK